MIGRKPYVYRDEEIVSGHPFSMQVFVCVYILFILTLYLVNLLNLLCNSSTLSVDSLD